MSIPPVWSQLYFHLVFDMYYSKTRLICTSLVCNGVGAPFMVKVKFLCELCTYYSDNGNKLS